MQEHIKMHKTIRDMIQFTSSSQNYRSGSHSMADQAQLVQKMHDLVNQKLSVDSLLTFLREHLPLSRLKEVRIIAFEIFIGEQIQKLICSIQSIVQNMRTLNESELDKFLKSEDVTSRNGTEMTHDEIVNILIAKYQKKTVQNIYVVESCLTIAIDSNSLFLKALYDIVRIEVPHYDIKENEQKVRIEISTLRDELTQRKMSRVEVIRSVNEKYNEVFVEILVVLNANKQYQPGSEGYRLLCSSQKNFARRSSRLVEKKFDVLK